MSEKAGIGLEDQGWAMLEEKSAQGQDDLAGLLGGDRQGQEQEAASEVADGQDVRVTAVNRLRRLQMIEGPNGTGTPPAQGVEHVAALVQVGFAETLKHLFKIALGRGGKESAQRRQSDARARQVYLARLKFWLLERVKNGR